MEVGCDSNCIIDGWHMDNTELQKLTATDGVTSAIYFVSKAANLEIRAVTQGSGGSDMLKNAKDTTVYLQTQCQSNWNRMVCTN